MVKPSQLLHRLRFETRLLLLALAIGLPGTFVAIWLLWRTGLDPVVRGAVRSHASLLGSGPPGPVLTVFPQRRLTPRAVLVPRRPPFPVLCRFLFRPVSYEADRIMQIPGPAGNMTDGTEWMTRGCGAC